MPKLISSTLQENARLFLAHDGRELSYSERNGGAAALSFRSGYPLFSPASLFIVKLDAIEVQ